MWRVVFVSKIDLLEKLGGNTKNMRKEKSTKSVVQITRNNMVDNETGVITEQYESTVFSHEREPNYVKLYLDHLVTIANLQGWTSKVLYELIGSTSYANEGQLVVVNSGLKKIIAEKLEMKVQSVTNAINLLKKENILIQRERGVYVLNPQFFGKGEWKDIAKLRYEVNLSAKGAEIQLIEVEKTKENTNDSLNELLNTMSDDEKEKLLNKLQGRVS